MNPLANLAFAHLDLPAIAVKLSGTSEDFIVDEVMELPPRGRRFVWLRVRHRDTGTAGFCERLAAALNIDANAIAWSGRKDAAATVTQWLAIRAERLDNRDLPSEFEVLDRVVSDEPLNLARHQGNRFVIRLHGNAKGDLSNWQQRLLQIGFPNYYGPQRFGDGQAVASGQRLLRGELTLRGRAAQFCLNAWQAALFNQTLSAWLTAGQPQSDDDLVWHERGGTALPRSSHSQGSVTGPLFGYKLALPGTRTWERELASLAQTDWTWAEFQAAAQRQKLAGTRRPFWQRPSNLQIQAVDAALQLEFQLPAGVYATSLIRELTRA